MSDNINFRDKDGATAVTRATDNAGVKSIHHIIETLESGVPTPVSTAAPLPVDGSAVTQPVSGPLTDAELRATPVPVSGTTSIETFPVQHIDAFSRVRTSNPAYRFDSQLTYQIDADLWDTSTSGGSVAHSATERWATLTANAAGNNYAILQSHYHSPYTPGRGQLVFVTFLLGAAPATGGFKRAGYFDGTNGAYIERTDSAINLVLKSSTSKGTETVPQADWNIDTLGAGVLNPSGLTFDPLSVSILAFQMQALYAGRLTLCLDIKGQLVPVHAFDCANEESVPYIAQANLPVRYEARAAVASGSNVVMNAICASVISEGGERLEDMQGRQFPSSGFLTNSASGTLLVIRCKQQLNSINQNAIVIPVELDISVADAGCWINVRRNATVTAGTFTDVNSTYSVMEECFAGNAGTDPAINTATGQLIDRFYLPASATLRASSLRGLSGKAILCYSHLLGAGDTLSIDYDGGGGTTDVYASVKWKEIR